MLSPPARKGQCRISTEAGGIVRKMLLHDLKHKSMMVEYNVLLSVEELCASCKTTTFRPRCIELGMGRSWNGRRGPRMGTNAPSQKQKGQ